MSDCCGNDAAEETQACDATAVVTSIDCPRCHGKAQPVGYRTLLHIVRSPHNRELVQQNYYLCTSADCEVAYVGQDGSTLDISMLRIPVALKQRDGSRILCNCFDISEAEVVDEFARLGHSPSRAFIVEQTREGRCACDVRNPAGRCCLKDFPKSAT